MRNLLLIALFVFCPVIPGNANDDLKIQDQKKETVITVHTCPMHPEIIQDKAGKCPKCGMNLTAKQVAVKPVYFCPMHPEITSEKPAKCPKCGMDLDLKETPKKEDSPKK